MLLNAEMRFDRRLDDERLWHPNLNQAEREAKEVAEEIRSRLGIGQVTVSIRDDRDQIQKEIVVVSS
jgi:hypothetical protein